MQQLSREYDVMHTICGTWPPAMYKTWGFVVCAGVAGYRSTEATKYMVKSLAKRCYPSCDDQVALNMHTYGLVTKNLNWKEILISFSSFIFSPFFSIIWVI